MNPVLPDLNKAADLDRRTSTLEEYLTPFTQLPFLGTLLSRVLDAAFDDRFSEQTNKLLTKTSFVPGKAGTILLQALKLTTGFSLTFVGESWVVTLRVQNADARVVDQNLEKALLLALIAKTWRPL